MKQSQLFPKMLVSGLAALLSAQGYAAALLKPVTITEDQKIEKILAVPSGLTVYTFDNDNQGVPTCYSRCAEVWPPILLTPAEEAGLKAPLGAVKRTTGVTQLTLEGKPLYLYFADRQEGDFLGDGIGKVWHYVEAKE